MANVTGFDPAVSGQKPIDEYGDAVPVGVWGDSNTDVGVFGTSGAVPPGSNILIANMLKAGVVGHGTDRPGMIGHSESACGVCAFSDKFPGLYAYSDNQNADPTVASILALVGNKGIAVEGRSGEGEGVVGVSWFGTGVRATTSSGTGVLGEGYAGNVGGSPVGVHGVSDTNIGVRGESDSANAMEGVTYGSGYGAQGVHWSTDPGGGVYGLSVLGNGVEGFTFSEDRDIAAIRGQSTNGYAGLFVGKVRVTGSIMKGGGGFQIDHPDDPKNKSLSHSFVESPEMLNIYSGTVTTDARGNARVSLPGYFESLNRDFRYQLTTIGEFAQVTVSEEIADNSFSIKSDPPQVKVSWQVTGVRRDAWAEANRIPVEEDKAKGEKGGYLHPELFDTKGAQRPDRGPIDAMSAALPDNVGQRAGKVLASPDRSGFAELVAEAHDLFAQRVAERQTRSPK